MQDTHQIPTGYKQTEVGVIPEGWEVKNIGSVCQIFGRIGFRGYTKEDIVKNNEGAISISPSNVLHGKINYDNCTYISWFKYEESPEIKIFDGDILFVKTGSTVGKTTLVKDLPSKATINPQLIVLKKIKIDSYFLSYVLKHSIFQNQINNILVGGAIPTLSQEQISRLKFQLPGENKERISIGLFLSNTDELIEKLEKLIAKKKAIKQGAMQELLTGKRRLPGFSEEWDEKKLGTMGKTYGGLSGKVKSDFGHGNALYIPFMNIMSNPVIDIQDFEKVIVKSSEQQNKAEQGDLFFNGSSETPEEVGLCSVITTQIQNLYLNSFCFGFRFNKTEKSDGLFYSYLFRSNVGRKLMYSLAQGATRYNLSKTKFLELGVPYPDPEEQSAIAKVLSNMDDEIDYLDKELAKYQQIKIGMMQQLLTGKIRIYGKN
jgi:type I restriction enzyme, S subunit